jgi:hypothetical protein
MTPAARQAARIAAGQEASKVHPELAPNGSLFTLKGGVPQAGSTAYGPNRLTHLISEAVADGGVQTQDRTIADALRGLGIYNETKL